MTVQSLKKVACLYVSEKRKVDFHLLSANLVYSFIRVQQAQILAVPAENSSAMQVYKASWGQDYNIKRKKYWSALKLEKKIVVVKEN